MAVIWEATDRQGRIVQLSEAAWSHVCARHRDVWNARSDVRSAVELADEIMRGSTYRHREIRYRRLGSDRFWLRVVVSYRPNELYGWLGDIITAHFSSHRPEGEVLLWPSQTYK